MWWKNHSQTLFKKIKLEHISGSIVSSFIQFVFIVWQVEDNQNTLKLSVDYLFLTHIKFFKKTKRGLELVSLVHFLWDVWRKLFLVLSSVTWPNFMTWLPLFREILGNTCIVIVCWPGCDVIYFKINHIFLIKPFFLHDQIIKTK